MKLSEIDWPDFADKDVSMVYEMLCDKDPSIYGHPYEHWEGRLARKIVGHLRLVWVEECLNIKK